MKRKVINKNGRDKAFIGAAVGAVASIATTLIGNAKQKKEQEKAKRIAEKNEAIEDINSRAQSMNQQYANQEYVDEYKNKITLKNGGKVSMKKKGNDRIRMAKKFACGGRKKADLGTDVYNDNQNVNQLISDNSGVGINSIANNTDYLDINTGATDYEDRIQREFKCGGRKRKRGRK